MLTSSCKVVWRRYLGGVGQFYCTLRVIYLRHCISISIKSGRVPGILEVMTEKFECAFLCPTVVVVVVVVVVVNGSYSADAYSSPDRECITKVKIKHRQST